MENIPEYLSCNKLAEALGRNYQYIYKLKKQGKFEKFTNANNKINYEEACKYFKINPGEKLPQSNMVKSTRAAGLRNKAKKDKDKDKELKGEVEKAKTKAKKYDEKGKPISKNAESDAKNLLDQIMDAINDQSDDVDWAVLNNLENKAKILKLYFASQKEKISHEKELGLLVNRETVVKILAFFVSTI
ncbi:MAG: hypothetical protein GY932_12685, partial [Arcobacter sp.]|nr:hypothetical protein [Arcobacter sp.]